MRWSPAVVHETTSPTSVWRSDASDDLELQFAALLRRATMRRRAIALKERCDAAIERAVREAMEEAWGQRLPRPGLD